MAPSYRGMSPTLTVLRPLVIIERIIRAVAFRVGVGAAVSCWLQPWVFPGPGRGENLNLSPSGTLKNLKNPSSYEVLQGNHNKEP